MQKITPGGLFQVLKKSFSGFIEDKVLKLSAALAYYTVFSLPPLLIMILFICGAVYGQEAVEGSIYQQLESFVGSESALQLQEMIKNAAISDAGNFAAVVGVITLLIGATTVFAEIQDSINQIWGLKPKPGKGLIQFILTRLLSFGVIASLGFLLLVSLGISALLDLINKRLMEHFPDITVVLFYVLNIVINLLVTSCLFAVIFKVLPDAKIRLRDVMAGAVTTAILFMLGKLGISFYIGTADVGSTYGAAGSLAVLLVWVYYSSFILYFGAEFTKQFALKYGRAIYPNKYAVISHNVEVEHEKGTLQTAEKKKEKEARKTEEKK